MIVIFGVWVITFLNCVCICITLCSNTKAFKTITIAQIYTTDCIGICIMSRIKTKIPIIKPKIIIPPKCIISSYL